MNDDGMCHKCGSPRGSVRAGILCYPCSEQAWSQVLAEHRPNDSNRRSGNYSMPGPGTMSQVEYELAMWAPPQPPVQSQSTTRGSATDGDDSVFGLVLKCIIALLVILAYFAFTMLNRMNWDFGKLFSMFT